MPYFAGISSFICFVLFVDRPTLPTIDIRLGLVRYLFSTPLFDFSYDRLLRSEIEIFCNRREYGGRKDIRYGLASAGVFTKRSHSNRVKARANGMRDT